MGDKLQKDLYICTSYYHILVSCIRKSISNNLADILIESVVPEAQNLISRIEKSKLFEGIIYFDRARVNEYKTQNKCLKLLFEHWYNITVVRNACSVPFKEYKNIYIFNDRTVVGRHIYDLKLKYILLEDGTNYFTDIRRVNSRDYIQEEVKRMLNPNPSIKQRLARALNYGYLSLGQSKFCSEIVVTKNENLFIPQGPKIKEAPLLDLVKQLNEEQKGIIFNIFFNDDARKFANDSSRPSVLILTAPLAIEKLVKTKTEQIKVFQKLVWKYQEDGYQVYIKPHPRDDVVYTKYFEKVIVLGRYYPVEVLAFSHLCLFDIAVTITSSAIFNLQIAKEMVLLGYDYLDDINTDTKVPKSQFEAFNNIPVSIEPAFQDNAVSIVIASNGPYLKYLSVLLESIAAHSAQNEKYDIVLFTAQISDDIEQKIHKIVNSYPNISVRFFSDLVEYFAGLNIYTFAYISKETWYRMAIPYVIKGYHKTIWLDVDMIVLDDLAKLYDIELDNNTMLGAVRCATSVGAYHNKNDYNKKDYTDEVLKLENPDNYFQAGTILFNNDYIKTHYNLSDIIEFCCSQEWKLADQDVLNVLAHGHTLLLDDRWNVLSLVPGRKIAIDWLPAEYYENYYQSRKNPKIIHYAGAEKPWKSPNMDMANHFWEYARLSSYYETFIVDLIDLRTKKLIKSQPKTKLTCESKGERTWKKRLGDYMFPKSTIRREVFKKFYYLFHDFPYRKMEVHNVCVDKENNERAGKSSK